MKKMSSYRKRKAELKVKDQTIESLNLKLDAKDQIIESKDETIKAKDQTIESKDETIKAKDQTIESKDETIKAKDQTIDFLLKKEHSSLEEKYRDEGKEHSKSCLGFE
ncbi:hypothetical protein ID0302_13250 [Helicobacter pylori]